MVQDDGPVGLDGVAVAFDDERAVADAGIVLTATLARRLGIEALVDEFVDLGDRPGAANVGAKVMTLVSAMALGDGLHRRLRHPARTPDGRGPRPPGCGAVDARDVPQVVHLRHGRQLDRVLADTLTRAWAAGAGPGRRAAGRRRRFVRRRGPRPLQAGRRVWLHPPARLPPHSRHPGGHRRGAAHPPRRSAPRRSPRSHPRPPGRAAALLGAVFRSRPTAPTSSLSLRPSTASTSSSSSASATSKTRPWRTFPPASSPPTPPGRSLPAWPTTCCARPASSAYPDRPSARRAPSAADCSRCPAASPGPHAAGRCTCRPTGPGNTLSSKRSPASARSPQPDHQHDLDPRSRRRGGTHRCPPRAP